MEHEHAAHVAAPPDQLFAALADPTNLPEYVPQMRTARPSGAGHVEVEARYDGHTQHGDAWLKTDQDDRRISWGSDGSAYSGWMHVEPDGDGSLLTLHLTTVHDEAPEREFAGTLDAIRRLAERRL